MRTQTQKLHSPEQLIRHSESIRSLNVSKSFKSPFLFGWSRRFRSFCSDWSQSMQDCGVSASRIQIFSPQMIRNELHELLSACAKPVDCVLFAASMMLGSSSWQLIVSTERWMSIESSGILSVHCLKHSSFSVCGLNQSQRFLKPPEQSGENSRGRRALSEWFLNFNSFDNFEIANFVSLKVWIEKSEFKSLNFNVKFFEFNELRRLKFQVYGDPKGLAAGSASRWIFFRRERIFWKKNLDRLDNTVRLDKDERKLRKGLLLSSSKRATRNEFYHS